MGEEEEESDSDSDADTKKEEDKEANRSSGSTQRLSNRLPSKKFGLENRLWRRFLDELFVGLRMSFSWCFFYGTQEMLAGLNFFWGNPELLAVCLALVLSVGSMFAIIPLDKVADWAKQRAQQKARASGKEKANENSIDKSIRVIIDSMGLLIGFGWEQCFDASIDILTEETHHSGIPGINPKSTKLLLSFFCAGLLVPAWRLYIVPFIVEKGWQASHPIKDLIQDLRRCTIRNMENKDIAKFKEEMEDLEIEKLAKLLPILQAAVWQAQEACEQVDNVVDTVARPHAETEPALATPLLGSTNTSRLVRANRARKVLLISESLTRIKREQQEGERSLQRTVSR